MEEKILGNLTGQNRPVGGRNLHSVLRLSVSIYFCQQFYLTIRAVLKCKQNANSVTIISQWNLYYAAVLGEMGDGHPIEVWPLNRGWCTLNIFHHRVNSK